MQHPMRLLALSLIYFSAVAHGAAPFPKLKEIATSFETNVELTDTIQKTTAIAREYYDFEDQTGKLFFRAFGRKSSIYFNGPTDMEGQVFTVDDNSCELNWGGVEEVDISFFGWTNLEPLYLGPSALILLGEKLDTQFVENTINTRGIKCDHYRARKEVGNETITLDYFFADKDWTMPYSSGKRIPLRIEVDINRDKTGQVSTSETIDFLYFRPGFSDKSVFQPPVGLGCWTKEPAVTLPTLPKQFYFGGELFDMKHDDEHSDTDVVTLELWYDYNQKIGRVDWYTAEKNTYDYADFKTGTLYHMHDRKTCRFSTLRRSVFLNFEFDTLVGQIKTPEQLLGLEAEDTDFYSLGQAEIRGIRCEVFEKAEHNVTFYDKFYRFLVTTVYFSSDRIKIQVDGNTIETAVPIATRVTAYDSKKKVVLKKQLQIFSFTDSPFERFYDYPFEACFPASNQRSYFVIEVQASDETVEKVEGQHTAFYEEAENKIITVANITKIRLPFLKIDYTVAGIYITGLMLDKPPALSQFWNELDEAIYIKYTAAYEIDNDAKDEESCAASCLGFTETCKGFHFCEGTCYMNTMEITDEYVSPTPINKNCMIYIRAVSDSDYSKDSLEKAMNNLKTAKDKKELKFKALIGKDTILLPAVDFITNLNDKGGESISDYPYSLTKAGYQLDLKYDTTIEFADAQSEEECYRRCKADTAISCSSFSYCAKASNKMCRFSSEFVGYEYDVTKLKANAMCDTFSLLYLDLFESFAGKVFTIPGNKTIESITTTEECAKNCKDETEFTCRGFEYCKKGKTCVLHTKHTMDLGSGESVDTPGNSDCVHYAARFVADYRDRGFFILNDPKSSSRNEISLEGCARACSEEVMNCSSFNYCPPTSFGNSDSSCTFSSLTFVDDITRSVEETCRLYTKRKNVEDWSFPIDYPEPDEIEGKGYTASGFAGLLVGMIILGLVVGALLFVAYSYYRARSGGDGLTVKFSKQENT